MKRFYVHPICQSKRQLCPPLNPTLKDAQPHSSFILCHIPRLCIFPSPYTLFCQAPSVTSCSQDLQDPSVITEHTTKKSSLHTSLPNFTFQTNYHLLCLFKNNHSHKFPLQPLDTFSPNPALSSSPVWRGQSHLQYPGHGSWGPVPSPAVCRPSPHSAFARTPWTSSDLPAAVTPQENIQHIVLTHQWEEKSHQRNILIQEIQGNQQG